MRLLRIVMIAAGCGAGCGARTAPSVDVAAAVRTQGALRVHQDLQARVGSQPRDVAIRLALASVAEQLGRPAEAIDALVAVERLGGPSGPRWHDDDRARLARLLLRRGRARLARNSPHALDDFLHVRRLGSAVSAADLFAARAALARSQLRHVDGEQRANARSILAQLDRAQLDRERRIGLGRSLAPNTSADPSWAGARAGAAPAERAAFGVWAWKHGARREAYDQLAAWHANAEPPRDMHYEVYYQRALAWWTPNPVGLSMDGFEDRSDDRSEDRSDETAADTVADGESETAVYVGRDAYADAAARFARARAVAILARNVDVLTQQGVAAAGVPDPAELLEIARSFRRSPQAAAHLSSELVARSVDASIAHATVGALFDALGDPARARSAWEFAASTDDDPAFVAGFAEACARAGDGDAALVAASQAAAAWGDPAVIWTQVARVLLDSGRVIDALTAARSALDLANDEVLPEVLDIAIEASRRVGRTAQAEAFSAQRAALAPQGRRDQREVDLLVDLLAMLPAHDSRRGALIAELVTLASDRNHLYGLRAVFALRQ